MAKIKNKETIGSRIKKIRIKKNLTIKELYKLTQIDEETNDLYILNRDKYYNRNS